MGKICEIRKGKGVLIKAGEGKSIWLERVMCGNIEQWADDWVLSSGLTEDDNLIDCQNFK